MAVDLVEAHARALEWTGRAVSGVRPEQWDQPSVCRDWSVHDLVNHVVSGNWWAQELTGGKTIDDVGSRLDGDVIGSDPAAAYAVSAEAAAAAFAEPDALERPVAVSYGPVPGAVYCGHRFVDVLIHGWDVARSTGQDDVMPPDLVEACWEVLGPQLGLLAGSGMFDVDVVAPEGADRQTALLAALGRRA